MVALAVILGIVGLLASLGLVTSIWAMTITSSETLTNNLGSLSAGDLTGVHVHSAFNEGGTLNAASTPPNTKHAAFVATLVAGVATIDLTALVGTNGAPIDGTGLKVQLLRIKNLGANPMTFAEGAANGYAFGGEIVTAPGGCDMKFGNDGLPDVAAGDRIIDVTGTAEQTAEVTIELG